MYTCNPLFLSGELIQLFCPLEKKIYKEGSLPISFIYSLRHSCLMNLFFAKLIPFQFTEASVKHHSYYSMKNCTSADDLRMRLLTIVDDYQVLNL